MTVLRRPTRQSGEAISHAQNRPSDESLTFYATHRVAFTSFSLIGAGVFALGLGVIFALVHWTHVNAQLAFLVSALISIEVNFVLNLRITWQERGGSLGTKFARFHTLRLITVPVNQGLFFALTLAGIPYLVATVATTALFTVLNYGVCHLWAFPVRVATAEEVGV